MRERLRLRIIVYRKAIKLLTVGARARRRRAANRLESDKSLCCARIVQSRDSCEDDMGACTFALEACQKSLA